jgi:hypothetical protein
MEAVNVDLHALANTPGAGKAAKALRDAGLYRDVAEDGRPVWEVRLAATLTGYYDVTVVADSEAAAATAAESWAKKNLCQSDVDFGDLDFESEKVTPGNLRDVVG